MASCEMFLSYEISLTSRHLGNRPGDIHPVKPRKRLRSIVERLALLLSRTMHSAGSPDSSSVPKNDIPSPSAPLSLNSESFRPQLSVTSLPRPLINLLEIGRSKRGDPPSIPLPVCALRTCYEDKGRMAAISRLDGASAARLADIVQTVRNLFCCPVLRLTLNYSVLIYLLQRLGPPDPPSPRCCR